MKLKKGKLYKFLPKVSGTCCYQVFFEVNKFKSDSIKSKIGAYHHAGYSEIFKKHFMFITDQHEFANYYKAIFYCIETKTFWSIEDREQIRENDYENRKRIKI